MDYKVTELKKHIDKRGKLVVFMNNNIFFGHHSLFNAFGQTYFVTFNRKGTVRGNHYHKKWREWFGVVMGKIQVELLDVKTFERKIFILDETDNVFQRIEIAPYMAHAFKSLTPFAILLNYANTEWTGNDDFKYKLI